MDNSKFLKGLLAVVEKQQAVLKKLAQAAPFTGTAPTPPQGGLGDAAKPTLRTVDTIDANLPADLKMGGPLVVRYDVNEPKDQLQITLTPAGKAQTQQVVTRVDQLVTNMISKNIVSRLNKFQITTV